MKERDQVRRGGKPTEVAKSDLWLNVEGLRNCEGKANHPIGEGGSRT